MSVILCRNSVDFRQTLRYAKRKGGNYDIGKPKIHNTLRQTEPGGRARRRVQQHSESKADAGKIRC